ncbi:MAG: T9SS type A sorting domain-containing protein [Bacteroidales bacterium]|nr:T9SS type A sorting domain-containing protein [Bacteroidales bacterium]
MKPFVAILITLSILTSLRAQSGHVAAGGSGTGAGGTVELSWGQPYCHYDASGTATSQGVQQPYCQPSYDTFSASVCQHQPFALADFSLTADSTATAGLRFFHRLYRKAEDCDNLRVLQLMVLPAAESVETLSVCDSLVWHGTTYRADTTATSTFPSANGCDSVVTLRLTVRRSSSSNHEAQGAYSYSWHGNDYTAAGIYSHTLPAANAEGCDSVLHLDLALLADAPVPVIYCYNYQLMMVDHYPGGSDSARVDYAGYRWYHDGELVPLAQNDIYYDLAGSTYRRLSGCFYVEVPAHGGRWVRSNEVCLGPAKAGDGQPVSMLVSPNPAVAASTVAVVLQGAVEGSTLALLDLHGRQLWQTQPSADVIRFDAPSVAGVYTLCLVAADGTQIARKLIVR